MSKETKHTINENDVIASLQIPLHVASSVGEDRCKRLMYSAINREFKLHNNNEIIWSGGAIEEATRRYNEI